MDMDNVLENLRTKFEKAQKHFKLTSKKIRRVLLRKERAKKTTKEENLKKTNHLIDQTNKLIEESDKNIKLLEAAVLNINQIEIASERLEEMMHKIDEPPTEPPRDKKLNWQSKSKQSVGKKISPQPT